MSRLGNTSSFKEIPNVLDENLSAPLYLHYKMAAEENTIKEKTIIFQSAWRSENGCRSKSLPSAGSNLPSFDLEAPQIHYSSNPSIILELLYLVIFYRIYNDLVIVHH
ncbi:hypothetical protein CEXT_616241 [Caerostris extrusa]|uniref:Uncharacterized protein n=1 Tax=Caerostris extrusa TaxID=172846 RepID=A0AAV4NT61_CAEEX|nr:hypothetical protein CEXT_616241 [Caerostris extrusa]